MLHLLREIFYLSLRSLTAFDGFRSLHSHLSHVQAIKEKAAVESHPAFFPEPLQEPSSLETAAITEPHCIDKAIEAVILYPAENEVGERPPMDSLHDPTSPRTDDDVEPLAAADDSGPSGAAAADELGPGPSADATAECTPAVLVRTSCCWVALANRTVSARLRRSFSFL
jgi:hypothetical protein